jgi:predicted nuclease of predicted toxin-antitoxin system
VRGFEAIHVAEVGMASARDSDILAFARESGRTVVTLDADFHALLAGSGAAAPFVVRRRVERATAGVATDLIALVIDRCRDDLEAGAMVSTDGARVRVRRLAAAR